MLFTAKEFERRERSKDPFVLNVLLKKEDIIILDRMRRKRHAIIYDTAGTISKKEAENAVERAEKSVPEIERMLKEKKIADKINKTLQ